MLAVARGQAPSECGRLGPSFSSERRKDGRSVHGGSEVGFVFAGGQEWQGRPRRLLHRMEGSWCGAVPGQAEVTEKVIDRQFQQELEAPSVVVDRRVRQGLEAPSVGLVQK